VLVVNRGLDSGSDPFLAWKAPADGDYHVLVSNTTMDGSAGHVYRLTIGALPYVTAWSPLTAQVGKDTLVQGTSCQTSKADAWAGWEGRRKSRWSKKQDDNTDDRFKEVPWRQRGWSGK
jgi:hypothetical protein